MRIKLRQRNSTEGIQQNKPAPLAQKEVEGGEDAYFKQGLGQAQPDMAEQQKMHQKMLQEKEQANNDEENKDNGKTGQRRQSTPTAAAAAVPKKEAPKPTISPSKAPNDNSADSNVSENTLSGGNIYF